MKQTRKASGGGNRRGGAKPRGRNVPGEANPGGVDSRCRWRRRGRNPREGAGTERLPAGCVGHTLEGSKTSGEDSRDVKTSRRGELGEDLKAGRAGRIPWRKANGEEERAKPIRRYDGSLIKL